MMTTMMLKPQDADSPVSVSLKSAEDDTILATVEETPYQLQLHWESPEGGQARNIATGEVIPFYLWATEDTVSLWMKGKVYTFNRVSTQARRSTAGSHGALPLSGEIKAPMPGSILKILVEPDQTVEANAPLLVMESMKMEMTLTAPIAGRVTNILCSAGQLVEMNAVLVKLEPQSDAS